MAGEHLERYDDGYDTETLGFLADVIGDERERRKWDAPS